MALGQRHVQVLLLFLCIVVNNIPRYSGSVAIVAMTHAATTNTKFEEFDWSERQKSYILASFYFGYFITQLPGGYAARCFGAKRIMLLSTLCSSLLTLFIPISVTYGSWISYCLLRVLQGLFQGFIFPCLHAYLAAWCPVHERNRLGALANTGIEFSSMLSNLVCAFIATSDMGWPGIFYLTGILGFIWGLVWFIYAADTPEQSRFITDDECFVIQSQQLHRDEVKIIPIPWRGIFTSLPVWTLILARTTQSWGFSTLQSQMPTYMNAILDMNMRENSIYSTLPYLAMWIMSYVFIFFADILSFKKLLPLTIVRKIFNTLATCIPAACLLGVGFMDTCDKTYAIILLTISTGFNAANTIGSTLNTIDLSPHHAGILKGIVNTCANIMPILTPIFASIIIKNVGNPNEWRIVFLTVACVYFIGNLFFIIYATAKTQPWNEEYYLQNQEKIKMQKK